MTKPLRVEKIAYIILFAIFFIGFPIALFLGFNAFTSLTQPKTYLTLPAPGETYIEVEEADAYEIYYEYTMAYQLNDNIDFYFENTQTGDISLSYPSNIGSTYTVGGTSGIQIAKVDLPQAGKYRVTASYTDSSPTLDFVIGKSVVMAPLLFTFFSFFIGSFSFMAGVGGLIIMLTVRASAKRKAQLMPVQNVAGKLYN